MILKEIFLNERELTSYNRGQIVFYKNDFTVTVDDTHNARSLALWNNKNQQIGFMETGVHRTNHGSYLYIEKVEIHKAYRGQGLASLLYKALIQNMNTTYKGLACNLDLLLSTKKLKHWWISRGAKTYPNETNWMYLDFKK